MEKINLIFTEYFNDLYIISLLFGICLVRLLRCVKIKRFLFYLYSSIILKRIQANISSKRALKITVGGIMAKLTKEQRHKIMSAVHSKNTKIEIILRKALWHKGIRYRKNFKICNCHVDIAITKYKVAVFCDGEFWHGKDFKEGQIRTNTTFWDEKIKRNMERDFQNLLELRDNGWTVLRFWESDIRKNLYQCVMEVLSQVNLCRARKQGK